MDDLPPSPEIPVLMEDGSVVILVEAPVPTPPSGPVAEQLPAPPANWVGPAHPASGAQPSWPEVTQDMINQVEAAKRGLGKDVIMKNTEMGLLREDLRRLSNQTWLNGEVVSTYLEMIAERSMLPERGLPKVKAVTTLQLSRLLAKRPEASKESELDYFSYRYVMYPINTISKHWALAVVDNLSRTITLYDSQLIRGHPTKPTITAIRHDVWKRRSSSLGPSKPYTMVKPEDVPQQVGDFDCGIFLCMFAEHISRGQPFNFSQEDIPYWRKRIGWELVNKALMC